MLGHDPLSARPLSTTATGGAAAPIGTSAGAATATGAAAWIASVTGTSAGTATASGASSHTGGPIIIIDVISQPANYTLTAPMRTSLNGSTWTVVITPTNAFNTYSGFNALLGNGNGGFWIVNGQINLYRDSDGAQMVSSGTVTNTAGNPITVTVDPIARSMTVAGASGGGNGTYTWTVGQDGLIFGNTANIGVGQYTDGSLSFAGTLSDVEGVSSTSSADGTSAGSSTATGTSATIGGATGTSAGSSTAVGVVEGIATGTAAGTSTATGQALWTQLATGTSAGSSTVTGQVPSAMSLGAHSKVVQIFGSGSTPATLTLTSVEAGSRIVVMMGGNYADIEDVPTSSGLTFTRLGTHVEYTDYPDYGVTAWYSSPSAGGTVSISNNVTAFDEISMWAVELKGAPRVRNVQFVERANAGATAVQNGPTVSTVGASIAIHSWWGSGPVGSLPANTDHVVTANRGTELEKWSFNNTNGYVQFFGYGEVTTAAESYQAVYTTSPTQGLQGWLLVFDLVQDQGTSAGSSTAAGSSTSTSTTTGTSAGSSTAAGVASALFPATGTSAGSSTAVGQSSTLSVTTGTAAGTAAAAASATATAHAAGTSTATSIAAGTAAALSNATGVSAAASAATGDATAVAAAAGTSTAAATASGAAGGTASASGNSAGSSTALGATGTVVTADGTSAGSATALGQVDGTNTAIGTSAGSATAAGVSEATAVSTGTSAGTSTVTGAATGGVVATGTSAGTSTVTGAASVTAHATGAAAGTSSALGQVIGLLYPSVPGLSPPPTLVSAESKLETLVVTSSSPPAIVSLSPTLVVTVRIR